MARIAIGGWQHETNTFATIRADYKAFESADEWPGLSAGNDLVPAVRGVHLPIQGALKALEERGHEILPLLWCSATPCSYVTADAYERIAADLLRRIEAAMPLDGIYLDLHGAMVSENYFDGEGEVLRRVRDLVGPDIPIFVSLDLHANVTPLMVEQADLLDIYRTYPHVDMAATGYRTASILSDVIESGKKLYKAWDQIDFIVPLNTGCSLIEPTQSIYKELEATVSDSVPSLSWACGFHLSDFYDVGPAVTGYGYDRDMAEAAVEKISSLIRKHQPDFYEKIWSAGDALSEAQKVLKEQGRTVVIADTQDNPGGGGAGDTIGLLTAMVGAGIGNTLIGVINDPVVVSMAREAGIGGHISGSIGGRAGVPGQDTLEFQARVLNLTDGKFVATGPMYKGANMEIGDTALLDIAGVSVAVCSKPVQTADRAHFTHLGILPEDYDVVAVKSSVHFRNDYETMASAILIVASPGEVFANPAALEYKHVRPELELTSLF